ncbi:coatomer subunit beta [Trichinella spiralis]|uniref:coatomer subunit beta n=1 Tax=Trichinella spiralis TaxID=6334 RepID=UPI0001EFC2DA|nr:coatomer subunit beta [Trichinella spiralis]
MRAIPLPLGALNRSMMDVVCQEEQIGEIRENAITSTEKKKDNKCLKERKC